MPVNPNAFSSLIQTNVNLRMTAVSGVSPLAQPNPSYFIAMCKAIGTGLIMGAPVITLSTSDSGQEGAPPVPGAGAGVGIMPDSAFFAEDFYTRTRASIISQFGSTSHQPYPPSAGSSGQYLLALGQGINDSISTMFPISWVLTSVNPDIYAGTGTINYGGFSGLIASAIQSQIISQGQTLQGPFWPTLALNVAESYVALIEQHSTGTVVISGECNPVPPQICGLPGNGSGTGTAA